MGDIAPAPASKEAEIAAYDPVTKRIFSINPTLARVDVLDISDPAVPGLICMITLGGRPNSVAFHKGVVAVAVENKIKTDPGQVEFFDVDGTPPARLRSERSPTCLPSLPTADGCW